LLPHFHFLQRGRLGHGPTAPRRPRPVPPSLVFNKLTALFPHFPFHGMAVPATANRGETRMPSCRPFTLNDVTASLLCFQFLLGAAIPAARSNRGDPPPAAWPSLVFNKLTALFPHFRSLWRGRRGTVQQGRHVPWYLAILCFEQVDGFVPAFSLLVSPSPDFSRGGGSLLSLLEGRGFSPAETAGLNPLPVSPSAQFAIASCAEGETEVQSGSCWDGGAKAPPCRPWVYDYTPAIQHPPFAPRTSTTIDTKRSIVTDPVLCCQVCCA